MSKETREVPLEFSDLTSVGDLDLSDEMPPDPVQTFLKAQIIADALGDHYQQFEAESAARDTRVSAHYKKLAESAEATAPVAKRAALSPALKKAFPTFTDEKARRFARQLAAETLAKLAAEPEDE